MAQEAQTRVQRAFQELLRDLDQSCLRKMQVWYILEYLD